MRTVGDDVGTGRAGISLPASRTVALEEEGPAALVVADGTTAHVDAASSSASGPLLSHARANGRTAIAWIWGLMGSILIRHRLVRKLGIALAGAAAVALPAGTPARAQDDAGSASPGTAMTCERVESPGRVRCEIEARAGPGESISWGEVVLVRTPPFVSALRGRIGPHDATVREAEVWRWALALVAREKGSGEVEARVRLVVCRGDKCAPRSVAVVTRVTAGP
jgi:hypothetical protein